MAAVVDLRVYTSTNAATESSTQTGISFLSIDSALTGSGDRTTNPVAAGGQSYEKHLRLKMTTAAASYIENILWWTDGSGMANVNLRAKEAQGTGGATPGTGGVTPVATAMAGDLDAYSRTSGGKGTWDAAQYTTVNHVTKALIMQLQPTGSAVPGAWDQETINYSYDEV